MLNLNGFLFHQELNIVLLACSRAAVIFLILKLDCHLGALWMYFLGDSCLSLRLKYDLFKEVFGVHLDQKRAARVVNQHVRAEYIDCFLEVLNIDPTDKVFQVVAGLPRKYFGHS